MKSALLGVLLLFAACDGSAGYECKPSSVTKPLDETSGLDGGTLPDCHTSCIGLGGELADCETFAGDGGIEVRCDYACGV